uniref:Uncharacterized protein n=1 Tax=Anguilla anguilla TaxID=7936 RepID=A0A0E9PU56_ANGAN
MIRYFIFSFTKKPGSCETIQIKVTVYSELTGKPHVFSHL